MLHCGIAWVHLEGVIWLVPLVCRVVQYVKKIEGLEADNEALRAELATEREEKVALKSELATEREEKAVLLEEKAVLQEEVAELKSRLDAVLAQI